MADRFWVGGTGNWSDATNHWATTTGGAPGAGNLPTASDNAIFDTNSHTVGYTVTIDASATCLDLTFGAPASGTITLAGSSFINVYGNLVMLAGMVRNWGTTLFMRATSGTKTITSNGVSIPYLNLSGAATFQLTDTLTTEALYRTGTFSANGQTVNLSYIYAQPSLRNSFTGANAFANLTCSGASLTTITLYDSVEVTGTITITGTSASSRILIKSNTVGTTRTITAAAVSLTDVDFTDITGAGAAAPFTGTRLGNCAGNSGITFTAAANKYWVGNTGNWNDTAWALSSGGAAGANNFPLAQDTCVFDANSFSANGQTVTLNAAYRIGSILCSGTDQTYIIATGGNIAILYGNVTLDANCSTSNAGGALKLSGRNTQTLISNGATFTQTIDIDSIGGTVSLGDNFVTTMVGGGAYLRNGTLDLNGYTFTCGDFASSYSTARTLKSSVSGGKIVTTRTAAVTVFTCTTSTNLTVDRASGTWTIEIGGNTTNIRTFAGGGKTWPALTFTNTTAGGELDFTGSNTFKSISVSNPAQTLKFTAGTTTTIEDTNGFPSGTSGNLVTIGSITAASHTLTKSGGGQISSDYLSISYSTATPGTTWYAGTGSTNGGNNSGWTFSAPPPPPFDFMPWFRRGY